jgi:hypothetical protein
MAVYKVPQDVEAEDKLIGPFSFRQFIYLIVAAMTIGVEWVLAQQFILLAIIPLPVTLLFLAIALPLRKDQPMEVWLAAVLRFFMRPRLKMWWPEGEINLVTIVAPVTQEVRLFKDLTSEEADKRLGELAEVIDTQGWSQRGIHDYHSLSQYSQLQDTVIAESSMAPDVMDKAVGVGLQFDSLIEEQEKLHRKMTAEAFKKDMQRAVQEAPRVEPTTAPAAAQPLPSSERPRSVTPPQRETPQQMVGGDQESTSTPSPKTAILNLSHNTLSISSLSKEAHRIDDKANADDNEVIVELHH